MDYKKLLEKARKIDNAATPGPWMWDLRIATRQCYLLTEHSGQYYVMGFERWGMQQALPTFQVYEKCEGEMHERGSHGMFRADKLAKSYPGKEHHNGFDDYINNPDAVFIAESRQLVHDLTVAVSELLARAESAEKKLAECEPKHGHWTLEIDTDTGVITGWRCSECDNKESDFRSPYCRMCGTVMDEEVK